MRKKNFLGNKSNSRANEIVYHWNTNYWNNQNYSIITVRRWRVLWRQEEKKASASSFIVGSQSKLNINTLFKDLEVNTSELAKRALCAYFWRRNGQGGLDSAGSVSIRTNSLNSYIILIKKKKTLRK